MPYFLDADHGYDGNGPALRPGRCSNSSCRLGFARPTGGPTWPEIRCPLCGARAMQSTFNSKEARDVLVLDRAAARALAAGKPIEIENERPSLRRLNPARALVRAALDPRRGARGKEWPESLTTWELHDEILRERDAERLGMLNAELSVRLHVDLRSDFAAARIK